MAEGEKEKPVSWFEESALKVATSCLGQKQGWTLTISQFSSGPECAGLTSGHPGSVETTAFKLEQFLGEAFKHPALTSEYSHSPCCTLQAGCWVMHAQHSLPWPCKPKLHCEHP